MLFLSLYVLRHVSNDKPTSRGRLHHDSSCRAYSHHGFSSSVLFGCSAWLSAAPQQQHKAIAMNTPMPMPVVKGHSAIIIHINDLIDVQEAMTYWGTTQSSPCTRLLNQCYVTLRYTGVCVCVCVKLTFLVCIHVLGSCIRQICCCWTLLLLAGAAAAAECLHACWCSFYHLQYICIHIYKQLVAIST